MIRKGYVYVTAFALFNASGRSFQYRFFERRSLYESSPASIILEIVIMFLIFFIPGLLIARWYYKKKDEEFRM